MTGMRTRLFVLVFCIVCVFSGVVVSGEDTFSDLVSRKDYTEQGKKLVDSGVLSSGTDPLAVNLTALVAANVVEVCRREGMTDEAIAGMLGNFMLESGMDPFAYESYYLAGVKKFEWFVSFHTRGDKSSVYKVSLPRGTAVSSGGYGLAGFTHGLHKGLNDYSLKNEGASNCLYIDADWYESAGGVVKRGSYLGSIGIQMRYIMETKPWVASRYAAGSKGGLVLDSAVKGWDDYIKLKDAGLAAKYFMAGYEGPTYKIPWVKQADDRAASAVKWLSWITGIGNGGISSALQSDGGVISKDVARAMGGYWSEEQMVEFTNLAEIDIEKEYLSKAVREGVSQSDLENLVGWERVVRFEEGSWLYRTGRFLVMCLGLLILFWGFLFPFAYSIDMVNPFFGVGLVPVMSFGRLLATGNMEEDNFWKSGGGKKIVGRRTVVILSLMAISFGIFIVSGKFYSVVSWLFTWLSSFLDKG